MAGIEALTGLGNLTPDAVNKIADAFRGDKFDEDVQAALAKELGTVLQPLFDLDDGEVKMLNALPAESVETMFHLFGRAINSGGKIDYKREYCEDGRPRMEIGYSEEIDHKPAGGDGPKSIGHAKITCFK
jgi:hypothetical protein